MHLIDLLQQHLPPVPLLGKATPAVAEETGAVGPTVLRYVGHGGVGADHQHQHLRNGHGQ